MMELDRKDKMIAIGAVVVAAVLVLFLKGRPSGSATEGGVSQDIPGGFSTASTVYVPTESYNLQYNTYKGDVSYSTNNAQTTTTFTNQPGSGTGTGGTIKQPPPIPIHYPPPQPHPPIITTNGGHTNPPTKQTGTTPKAPSAKAPAPPVHHAPQAPKMIGTMHYATPSGGWNQNSVVDYVKEHGGNASFSAREKLAAANGIKGYTGTAAQNQSLLSKLKKKYGA